MASHALKRAGKTEFDDLSSDMEDAQRDRYQKAVRERWPDLFRAREEAEWRQMLLGLVDQHIERYSAKLEVYQENADAQAERTVGRLSFDPTHEGEVMRNYMIKCSNALFRGMASYRDFKAETKAAAHGESDAGPRAIRDERSQDPGHADQQSARLKLPAPDLFESGDGHHVRSGAPTSSMQTGCSSTARHDRDRRKRRKCNDRSQFR